MLDLENFKNEIVESIDNVTKEVNETNTLLEEILPNANNEKFYKLFNQEIDLEDIEENKDLEEEIEDDESEEIEDDESEEIEDDELEENEIIEVGLYSESEYQEIIIEELQKNNENIELLNDAVSVTGWTISITIVIALGFHYFINQFSKW